MFQNDTIAAIATGLTDSGIGIIRISGVEAVNVGNSIFRTPKGKASLADAESHMMQYGYAVDNSHIEKNEDWDHFIVDEVMAVVLRAPRSFTGEDTVELHCHGGVLVMQKILGIALKCGARLAEPGEFTKRSFLNGKMDLSEAEAVMDVIQSKNEYALASSVDQLKGNLSKAVKSLRDEILYETAFIESALDDPEHISLDGYSERLSVKVENLIIRIKKMIDTTENGRLIKEGISTVIVGKPNVGKSSFLNLLLGEERAIVTDIAGTTRDVLKEHIMLHGIGLNIIDTAGIRKTDDAVEKVGVDRARHYAMGADLIVYMVDGSVPLDGNDREILSLFGDKKIVVLLNKSDLHNVVTLDRLREFLFDVLPDRGDIAIIKTSMKSEDCTEQFENVIREMFFDGELLSNQEIVITNIRHKEALKNAYESMFLVKKSIQNGMEEDFFSIDLMDAYSALGKIIGEEVDDDLVEEIFSKFCMGK